MDYEARFDQQIDKAVELLMQEIYDYLDSK